jgi:hypothetical protein
VWRKWVLVGAVAAAFSAVDVAVASADNIDYGTNQAAWKSAARAANAAGYGGSFCFETGPGHHWLYLDD